MMNLLHKVERVTDEVRLFLHTENFSGVLIHVNRLLISSHLIRNVWRCGKHIGTNAFAGKRFRDDRADFGQRERLWLWLHVRECRMEDAIQLRLEGHDASTDAEDDH